jgi:DNA repair protein RecO (recombination protein O)
MRDHVSEAIILRHLDYGEADRIVTFFTAEHGRLKGFARGARKSRRRFGPALEPFSRVRLHWKDPASGELATLKEAQLLDLHAGLRTDLAALALAGYGCELVEALLGEATDHPRAYRLLGAFLDHLDGAGAAPEARLLLELRVLALAGYAPHLLHCAECGSSLGQGAVSFDAGRGGSLCRVCAGVGGGAIRADLLTLGTLARCLKAPLDFFAGVRLSPRTLGEAGPLLRDALGRHLNRPLKSLIFLERTAFDGGSPDVGK